MTTGKKSKYWIIIVLAGFVCFYYVIPKIPAYIVEIALLLLSLCHNRFHNRFNFSPLLWYGLFFLYILIDALLRDQEMIYVTSCLNVTLFLLILSLLIESKENSNLFIKASSYSGALFSLFILFRFSQFLGVGRLGWELPGTRIDSPITLGYIFLYIMCMQIYSFFEMDNNKFDKFFLIVGFALTFYLTILTGTRKAMYLPILYLYIAIFLNNRRSAGKLIFYTSIIIILGFLSLIYLIKSGVIDEKNLSRIQGSLALLNGKYELDASTIERKQLASGAIELFYQHPFFGNGVDNTLQVLSKHPHNNLLSTLSMGGIVMFMFYYWGYLQCYFSRKFNRKKSLSFFAIVAIILPLSDFGTTSFNIIYFNILVALFMLTSRQYSFKSSNQLTGLTSQSL